MKLIVFKVICLLSVSIEILIFLFLTLLIANRIPSRIRDRILGISNAFSGGIFLSGGFIHLLGESIEALHDFNTSIPWALVTCSLGFILVFFLEKVIFSHFHHSHHSGEEEENASLIGFNAPNYGTAPSSSSKDPHNQHPHGKKRFFTAIALVIVLSIHSFITGIALGLQKSSEEGLPILIAIVSHKWVESFAIGVSFIRNSISKGLFVVLGLLYAAITPFGIGIGIVITYLVENESVMEYVDGFGTALAAGTFIYVATIDVLAEEFQNLKDKYWKALSCSLGFIVMSLLVLAMPHQHEHEM